MTSPQLSTMNGLFVRLERLPLKWMMVVPALAAAVTFVNTLPNELIYDDVWTADLAAGFDLSLQSVLRPRGLTYALHKMDALVWGAWTPGFHLTNVLLHALASSLAALAAVALAQSRRIGIVCGLLFAVHPVHTEVVASFAYRKDALAMVFVSLALILWRAERRRAWAYAGAMACYGLAILAKEVAAAALPVMLFASDLTPSRGHAAPRFPRLGRAFVRALPFAAAGVLAAVWFVGTDPSDFTKPGRIARVTEGQCVDYGEVAATTAALVPEYGRLLLFPSTLSADYAIGTPGPRPAARIAAGVVVLLVWFGVGMWLFARAPAAGFAMVWVPVMLVPCTNLIPVSHFFIADRYLYVPSFGICLLAAIGLVRLFDYGARRDARGFRGAAILVTVALVLAGGIRSAVRNRDWRDAHTLWTAATRAGHTTLRVHNNLGVALAEAGRVDEAIPEFRAALDINPGFDEARSNLAQIHVQLGAAAVQANRPNDALRHFAEALRADPLDATARERLANALADAADSDRSSGGASTPAITPASIVSANNALGRAALKRGERDVAGTYFTAALRVNPDHAPSREGLGLVRLEAGALDEAAEHFRAAIRLKPTDPEPRTHLGVVFARRGQFDPAIEQYTKALHLDPRHAEANNHMGVALTRKGKLEDAVTHFKSALRASPDYPSAYSNLASTLANLGRTADAIAHYEEALRLVPDYAHAHVKLARVLAGDGQLDRAARHYNEALRVQPGLEPARDGLREIQSLQRR